MKLSAEGLETVPPGRRREKREPVSHEAAGAPHVFRTAHRGQALLIDQKDKKLAAPEVR